MAVVRETHDHGRVPVGILGRMDDPATVVPLRSPDGLDLRQLRAFMAVAEELNFGRAAQRLYVSQPALSRQIKSLERVIGCELLLRDTHRVELTLAGHALYARAGTVLTALDEAIAATRSVGGELNARIMSIWAPMLAVAASVASIESLREIFEDVLASMPVPDDLAVRPVRAGGVPSLIVGAEPAVLHLHGGGHALGSAYGYRALVSGLATAGGFGVLVPDFRLAPEHPYPAALDDAVAAYRWLADRRPASEIVLSGDSSGCGLVLGLLARLRAAGDAGPAGAILMCPGLDPEGGVHEFGGPIAALHQAAATYAAVGDGDLTGSAPLLVQYAVDDPRRADAEAVIELARSCGVHVRADSYRTGVHDFQLFWTFLPEAADAMRSAAQFVQSALSTGEATSAG